MTAVGQCSYRICDGHGLCSEVSKPERKRSGEWAHALVGRGNSPWPSGYGALQSDKRRLYGAQLRMLAPDSTVLA